MTTRLTELAVSTTGNITGGNVIANVVQTNNFQYANGQPFTGGGSSYGNANVATFMANFGSNTISTTGNITSNGVVRFNSLSVNQTANNWTIAGNMISAPSGAFWNSNPESLDEYITSAVDGYINLTSLYANGNTASQVHLEHGLAQIIVNNGVENIWAFDDAGSTIFPTLTITRGDTTGTLTGQALLFGDSAQEALISTPDGVANVTPNSQRLVINPGAGAAGTTGEGGDIYLYAGRGGDAGGSGGDIKIRGGLGPVNGDGGYLDIQGGEADADGAGGRIDIRGGQSGNSIGGNINIDGGQGQTRGGNINIQGGQGIANTGGNVNITGGVSGNGLPEYGNINISAGASSWRFDNTGNLTLPAGGNIQTASGTNGNIGLHPDGNGTVVITGGAIGPLLLLQSDSINTQNRIEIDNYGTANNLGGVFTGRFSRGNIIAPVAIQAGDQLAALRGKGYDGSAFSNPVGAVSIIAFDNWAANNAPTALRFYTTGYNDGSTPILNMQISPTGNVDIFNGNLIVSGGGGYLQGNAVTGNDGLYAGSAGFTPLGSNVVAQFGANSNSYSQINFQNINDGTSASTDYILTANNGDDSTYFADFGIAGNNHSDSAFFGDTTTANDAYLYVVGADVTGPGSTGPGNLILGSTNGNIKMFVGNTAQANVVQTITTQGVSITGNVSASGNVTGAYIKGNGSELTSLPAPVVTQDITSNGAMSIMTYDGNIKYVNYATVEPSSGNIAGGNITTTGLVSATGNVTGNYFIGNGSQLTGISSGIQSSIVNGTSNVAIATANGNATITANAASTWTFGTDSTLTLPAGSSRITSYGQITIETDNNASGMYLNADGVNLLYANANVTLRANSIGTNKDWNFGNTGVLTLPNSGVINTTGNSVDIGSDDAISLEANAAVNIYTDTNGNTYQWAFGTDGTTQFPNSVILAPVSQSITMQSDQYSQLMYINANVTVAPNMAINSNFYVGQNNATLDIVYRDDSSNQQQKSWLWSVDGTLTLPTAGRINFDYLSISSDANVSAFYAPAGNVQLAAGIGDAQIVANSLNDSKTWTFGNTGNLTAPGNVSAVGNVTAGNISAGSGTITGGNVNGANFNGNVAFGTGTIGGSGNITGGNISAVGNVTAGNVSVTGNVSGNTAGFAIGYRDIPQISFTGNATIATTDAGKHYYSTLSTGNVLTIANNASQGFQVGAAITVVNQGTGNITVAQGSGVTLYLAGNATSGNRTVATFGMATLIKVATDTWFINGTGVT